MKKLDFYITLNLKMVSGYCAILVINFLMIFLTYLNTMFDSAAAYMVGGIFSPVALFAVTMSLKKICYSSLFSQTAGFYEMLPVDKKTVVAGKIVAAGICAMGLIPVIWAISKAMIPYGIAAELIDFLVSRGMLPSETPVVYAIVAFTAFMFMFAIAAVVLISVLYFKGIKKWSKITTRIMVVLASLLAAAVVSLPWIVKIVSSNASVTVKTPVISLLIAIGVLSGAAMGACNLEERGGIDER